MSFKTPGIVIKRSNFSEADRILTIFTQRFGKVKAMAKGVRKLKSHLAGSLEPFILSELQLHEGRTFYTVTGAAIIEDFNNVHTDLDKMAKAFYLGELIDKFEKEDQKSEQVFQLSIKAFESLNNLAATCKTSKLYQNTNDRSKDGINIDNWSDLVLRIFEIQLLKRSGFWGDMDDCLHCKEKLKPVENYWDGEEGGIICGKCQQQFHHGRLVSNNLIKIFRLIEKEGFDLVNRLAITKELELEVESIVSNYIKGILETDLKSERFAKSVI